MSEAQARRVLDDPRSTPEQRRQAEIVLGMPPADGGLGNVVGPAGVPPGPGAGQPGPDPALSTEEVEEPRIPPPTRNGKVVGPAGVPPGEGAGPPGPPPDIAEMTPSERAEMTPSGRVEAEDRAQRQAMLEQAKLRQRHLTEKERLAALEAMDLSKYEK